MKKFIFIFSAMWISNLCAQSIPNNVTLRDFFQGQVSFSLPVFMVPAQGKDSVYYVVEQPGTVSLVKRSGNAWVESTFVTVPVSFSASAGAEDGLLGLAFHPNFAVSKKYYLYFLRNVNGKLKDMLVERTAKASLSKDSGLADRVLLSVDDPANNHNGGTINFGSDGYLYLGIGDGGIQNDPAGRAQNRDTLLGKILRIDVDKKDPGLEYAIPSDNPFVGKSGRAEIWAYGFRNPYRWSFHPKRGELWVGDVGQDNYEEVDFVPKGGNMGWNTMEGLHCRPAGPATCDTTGLLKPVVERPHSQGDGAVIGGVFFQGDPTSLFYDVYFFGDNSSGKIWAMRVQNGTRVTDAQVATFSGLSALVNDNQGRVFGMSVTTNTIRVLESPDMKPSATTRRIIGKTFAPISSADVSKLSLHELNGRKASGKIRTGIYFTRDADNVPAMVPVLK